MTQLPSPQRQVPAPLHPKRLRPRTYSVAVYLVVAIVLFQAAMIIAVFWLRAMVVSVNVKLPKAQGGHQPSIADMAKPKPPPDLKPVPNLPSLPSLNTNNHPRAGLLSVPGVSDQLQQISNLNDEALSFLQAHAYQSALETLIKAEDIDPRHPDTLKNLADTYTLINDPAQAKIYWQRLVDLGPGVGKIYAVAEDHVVLLGGNVANILNDKSSHPRLIYVDSVEKTPVETQSGQAQFHLRATLMKQNHLLNFDQKKLQPYVIFYQQLPDGTLVPDLGQRKGAFDDTFLFWNNKTSEPFGVDYVMPIPGMKGQNNAQVGNYYGFVIGIYYDKILQDARSEPSDLVNRIPLPNEIE